MSQDCFTALQAGIQRESVSETKKIITLVIIIYNWHSGAINSVSMDCVSVDSTNQKLKIFKGENGKKPFFSCTYFLNNTEKLFT